MERRDVDMPMGNAEMRLLFAGLENEIADVKGITLETRDQAKKTNGRVNWLEKSMWMAMGALPLLSLMSLWMMQQVMSLKEVQARQGYDIQAAVDAGLEKALSRFETNE